MTFSLVALHRRWDLLDACVVLLNSQWTRSESARLHSLEKSCEDLPCCLVMIDNSNSKEKVAGHCRLATLPNQSKAVFIESVVVPIDRRGQGLGRHLMELAEDHVRHLGYTHIYLTTHDKQGFYEHLGYQFCKPFGVLNAQVLRNGVVEELLPGNLPTCDNISTITEKSACSKQGEEIHDECIKKDTCANAHQELCVAPQSEFRNMGNRTSEECLPAPSDSLSEHPPVPPGPPPPPPPPPPPVSVPAITTHWMMKDL